MEAFDLAAARRYGERELRPEDSYHAGELLAACDEIERLQQALQQLAADDVRDPVGWARELLGIPDDSGL